MFIFVVAFIAYEHMCLVVVCAVAFCVRSSWTIISLKMRDIVYFNPVFAVMIVPLP